MDIKNLILPIFWEKLQFEDQRNILTRPINKISKNIKKNVKNILNEVFNNGDNALYNFNLKFDNILTKKLKIDQSKIINSEKLVSENVKKSINIAISNITNFHKFQLLKDIHVETQKGIFCSQLIRPLNIVGLYVPGGKTPLLSTVLMLAIPAKIAGCKEIIICTPPPISNEILYSAKICGIQDIFQVGGAQAIAAMGFGTLSIPKVDKIFGPGNIWVTEAKRQINKNIDLPSIDMLAGPSEVLVIADKYANSKFIAADLLSQAEHGSDSHVILLTTDINIFNQVKKEIILQLNFLSRSDIIKQSLINSKFIIVKDLNECIKISNEYGPEHLIIQTYKPEILLEDINNAGSIFLGKWSPESVGDYASGTNHVLPTYGQTKSNSGLSVIDFQKRISVQKIEPNGLLDIAPTIEILAGLERLTAHKNAVQIRIKSIKEKIYENK